MGVKPKAQEEPRAVVYRHIGLRHLTKQESHTLWNRELQFPELLRAVDRQEDRWRKIPSYRDFGVRRLAM